MFDEKTGVQKSRESVPLNPHLTSSFYNLTQIRGEIIFSGKNLFKNVSFKSLQPKIVRDLMT
jgi:hypothetical protein